ncbi:MAG TPA: phasin family protein [Methylocella sp.]|nr:phasin family protein [Methylocella sp.]
MADNRPDTDEHGEGSEALESSEQPRRKRRAPRSGSGNGAAQAAADLQAAEGSAAQGADREPEEPAPAGFVSETIEEFAEEASADAGVFEAAVSDEIEVVEELGKEELEAAEAAVVSLAESFRKFAGETASFSLESIEAGSAFAGDLLQAKSFPDAMKIQLDFVMASCLRLLEYFGKMGGLYWIMMRGGEMPVSSEAAKAKA